jgi:methylenetetrahydrofolate dehydrogenase (NADP+)/methenyltetrahydrofolate cyclohydrolase
LTFWIPVDYAGSTIDKTILPGLVKGENIKDGAIVIDAGTSEVGGKIEGDVETSSVLPKAGYLAATPGGVGPLTVAMLLENVVEAAENFSHK